MGILAGFQWRVLHVTLDKFTALIYALNVFKNGMIHVYTKLHLKSCNTEYKARLLYKADLFASLC